MRGQQHRDAFALEPADHLEEFERRLRIEPGRRLVQDGDGDVLHQDFGKPEPLAHAARVRADPVAGDLGKIDALERIGDARLALRLGEADQPRGVAQIVARAEIIVEADRIRQVADPALDRERFAHRIMTEHPRGAGRNLGQPEQHEDRRRLAGAIRAEQAEDLPARHRERHVVDRRRPVVALGQALRVDDDVAHRRPNLATAPTSTSNETAMMPMPVTPQSVDVVTPMRKVADALSPRAVARRLVT